MVWSASAAAHHTQPRPYVGQGQKRDLQRGHEEEHTSRERRGIATQNTGHHPNRQQSHTCHQCDTVQHSRPPGPQSAIVASLGRSPALCWKWHGMRWTWHGMRANCTSWDMQLLAAGAAGAETEGDAAGWRCGCRHMAEFSKRVCQVARARNILRQND